MPTRRYWRTSIVATHRHDVLTLCVCRTWLDGQQLVFTRGAVLGQGLGVPCLSKAGSHRLTVLIDRAGSNHANGFDLLDRSASG